MSFMQEAEIKAVFESIGRPLIQRGMDELQQSKENFFKTSDNYKETVIYKTSLSNGTGVRNKSTDRVNHAELE